MKKKVYSSVNIKKILQPAIKMSKRRFEEYDQSESQKNQKPFHFDDLSYVEDTVFWNVKVPSCIPFDDSPNKVKNFIDNVEFDNTVSAFDSLTCSQKKLSPSKNDTCTENPYTNWCIDFSEGDQVLPVESILPDDTDPLNQLITFEDLRDALFLFL